MTFEQFIVCEDTLTSMGIIRSEERNDKDHHCITPDHVVFCEKQWESLISDPFSPLEKLEMIIPGLCDNYYNYIKQRLINAEEVRKSVDRKEREDLSSFIDDYLQTYYEISTEKDVWLNVPVWLNIGLTIDSWSDYTINVTYPAYLWEEYEFQYKRCFSQSSIMWLTRRQGYKQADLRKAQHLVERAADLEDPSELIPSPYLYSAAMEIWHELTIHNQLGFFLKLPLKEVFLLKAMQRWGKAYDKWPGYILVSKDVRCGFYSTWVGSCSLLGIKLEKDIKISLCDVEIYPDGAEDRYAMIDVHEDYHAWDKGKILHWGFPRQFKRDAALYGFDHLTAC